MKSPTKEPGKGKILVAEPFLGDPSFERTVIILAEHNEEGSVGFVLNRPLNLNVDNLFEEFPKFDSTVYYGGPVEKDSLYFLHSKGDLIPDSMDLGNNIFWSGRFDVAKELIETELLLPSEIKFFLGYSGWGADQLNEELNEGTWMVLEIDIVDIFKDVDSMAWRTILTNLGGEYKLWANSPSDPLSN